MPSHIFLYPLPVDKHLGGFHILAIVNNVATDMGGCITLQDPDFNSFGNTPRNGFAGSSGN